MLSSDKIVERIGHLSAIGVHLNVGWYPVTSADGDFQLSVHLDEARIKQDSTICSVGSEALSFNEAFNDIWQQIEDMALGDRLLVYQDGPGSDRRKYYKWNGVAFREVNQ